MSGKVLKQYEKLRGEAIAAVDALWRKASVRIQVGSATCEHAAGSEAVWEEFRRHIESSGRDDILLHRTGCTGRCSREPIVGVIQAGRLPVKYHEVDRDTVHEIFHSHVLGGKPVTERMLADQLTEHASHLMLCDGSGCGGVVQGGVKEAFLRIIAESGMAPEKVRVISSRCLGFCAANQSNGEITQALLLPENVLYTLRDENDVRAVVQEHLIGGRVVERLRNRVQPMSQRFFDLYGDLAFFNRQHRIALRNAGVIDPESLHEYVRYRGFEALSTALDRNDPEWVVTMVSEAKLRGRGGGGYPTGLKWAQARKNNEKTRYIICNADEGDPGAFMDRSMLESDPFSVVEGLIIGGFATGAQRGFFYIRAEYPLAIRRIEHAIETCRANGLLGKNILGSGFSFDIEIRLGAGAFVCGEETALIHSIEGERGQPRIRPPFPTECGLWGKPTVINNVETFASIAPILKYGSDWFSRVGTPQSGGTKVFALAGKIRRTGLVEVPVGTTLRHVVEEIGGGTPDGKAIKAVQTGGPAGGCIPAEFLDTPVDYDTLAKLGSIMGSGGMIVLDEDDCMVDVAKFFMEFIQDESCGKCTPCREGTKRMLEILERITSGKALSDDIDRLERLGRLVKRTSLCGLGRAAPNPILSTLQYYREEYEAHVHERRCPARKCRALVHYEISAEKCVGCTMCAKNCPVPCITGSRKEVHVIEQNLCIKCGRCFEVCRFNAVLKI